MTTNLEPVDESLFTVAPSRYSETFAIARGLLPAEGDVPPGFVADHFAATVS
jgi:hypothetical protein